MQHLLVEALEVAPEAVTLVSREPLGAGSVSGFDVAADRGGGDSGDPLRYYVDTSRQGTQQETGLVLGDLNAPEARIWLHPADPHLPALAAIAFHDAAASLLARCGVTDASAPTFIAYRPGRRAVLRVDAPDRPIWVKVVRPSRIERIISTHVACEQEGLPVPAVLGWSPDGVILFENAVGTPAAEVLWDPDDLVTQVDELRTRIASVETPHKLRGVADRLDWYADGLSHRDDAAQVARLARGALADTENQVREQVTHGDLHFGQLFLSDDGTGEHSRISGLLDVDTMGIGDPAEDPAAFIAHATVSAMLTPPEARERVWSLVEIALSRWGSERVRALFAIHMLGHALAAVDRDEEVMSRMLLRNAQVVLSGGQPSDEQR
ncbi:phosphotransferase family protein [Leucobacter denitrificans]|uniref:Aminoglycoside phosphotransferase family protein n=1 Tax=Leucobacter denitrificans TaxID=683042 RepID=A0A7G9S585_9MICO|nr:aminoglycoside phosphotransferase family protein [Leucobacter denitrificans]QNN63010.1 aminoglycoside phosphotransferase family protein [Leucobacter denitrificans]